MQGAKRETPGLFRPARMRATYAGEAVQVERKGPVTGPEAIGKKTRERGSPQDRRSPRE